LLELALLRHIPPAWHALCGFSRRYAPSLIKYVVSLSRRGSVSD